MSTRSPDDSAGPRRELFRPFLPPELELEDQVDYRSLAEFGVHYDSTMREVNLAGLEAQKRGELTPERRRAWKELRNPERRLALDLLHIQPDPTVFGVPADEREMAIPEPEPPEISWPDIPLPSAEALLDAVRHLPVPVAPEFPELGPPPPIEPDLWKLLEEAWPHGTSELPPLTPPESFLENEP